LTEAVQAACAIDPKVVIPMHRSKADPQEFKKTVEKKSKIHVMPLKIGEIYKLV
jgi:L-ascorbate metabolism protein UlaG (beta-lactamase superfamily)